MSNRSLESLIYRFESSLEKLERKKWLLFLFFLTLYFAGFCLIAAKAMVTNDETFTIYIARLPSLQAVWNALATGAEQTPPLIYLITRADFALLGTSPLAVRLPEILGFLVMCVCLFYFVSKRSSAFYGFIAMLFPLMTQAFGFVFFARAYALVLGFSALALLCWHWAIEDRHRMLALVGLWASLAAGVSSHYYAVLSLFPLGLGELVRTIRRKKIDVGVWVALGLSLFPLILFLPLIESARKFAPHFWAKPHWSSMAYYYPLFLLFKSTVPLLAIFLVVAFYTAFLRPNAWAGPPRARLRVPLHEWAMVLGFLLTPAVGVVLSKTVVGAYSDPCALSAVLGLSIAIALGLYSVLDTRLTPALCLGLLLCAFLMIKEVHTYRRVATEQSEHESTYAFLETNARGDAPIVISDPSAFTELTYDPPQGIGQRLLYLADPQMGLRYTGTDDAERGLLEMKRWADLNVRSFPNFVASGQKCYILLLAQKYPYNYEWVIPALRLAHRKITLLSWRDGKILFSANPGGNGKVPAGDN